MSFSTGGIFYQESVKVAGLYIDNPDWKKIREIVMRENILQARTHASSQRISREICGRLALLSALELQVFIDGSSQDQACLLWLAVCRRHRFICEFAVEVLREKFLIFQYELNYADYDAFFNAKASWDDDLENLSESTRKKLRRVLFQILREAGLLSAENRIIPAILSADVLNAVKNTSPGDLSVFPVAESDIKEWLK
jgi:hypothetical protein